VKIREEFSLTLWEIGDILYEREVILTYTAVFQCADGKYIFEPHVATHDRSAAWREIDENRQDKENCLVLLIDGQANVKTFEDIVDISR